MIQCLEETCPVCLGEGPSIADGKEVDCHHCGGSCSIPTKEGRDLLLFLRKHLYKNELVNNRK